jgi:hypothetical protein
MLRELVRELWMSKRHMPRSCLGPLTLVVLLSIPACILRPGMNSDCTWPPEPVKALDLGSPSDHRHLIVDAELVEELVDRYRFSPPDGQRQCEQRLAAVVASLHSVDVSDVARAREDIPKRGLDLPTTVPVVAFFLWSVLHLLRRVERRFGEEPWPLAISLIVASVAVTGVFVGVGELWTSVVQMIRVGSHHVGGRVNKLMWVQNQRLIFIIGFVLFWTIVLLRKAAGGMRAHLHREVGG